MADIVTKAVRSRMMSGIRGTNTRPEIRIRQLLHQQGFRFRLHASHLPGKPDIVLPSLQAVIFAHGCFWHGHDCHLFKWPQTRREFWKEKILDNRKRDEEVFSMLVGEGWRIMVIWECTLKGKQRKMDKDIVSEALKWLKSKQLYYETGGVVE